MVISPIKSVGIQFMSPEKNLSYLLYFIIG